VEYWNGPYRSKHQPSPSSVNVLFVCTGNTCRSPIAEAVFRDLCQKAGVDGITIRSAGLAAMNSMPASGPAIAVLEAEGIALPTTGSTVLTPQLMDEADLIVTMTASHLAAVKAASAAAADKVFTLLSFVDTDDDIADPAGGDPAEYRHCLESMRPALDALREHVRTTPANK